jgi:diguanylate cyclase (GGDEF)-like protein
MKAISRWLRSPVFDGDSDKTRRADLINKIATGFLAFALAVFVGNLIGGKTSIIVIVINVSAFCLLLPVLAWLREGRFLLAQAWLLIVAFGCVTAAIASLGSIRAPVTALYLSGVIVAGMLFDRRGVVYATAACSASVLGLILAENAGLLPPPNYRVGLPQWVTYTALCGFTGSLIYSLNQVTKDALARAEAELGRRKVIEEALNFANHKLSQRVEEVEHLQQELQEQALRDSLTGLYNRRYLNDAIDRELVRAKRDLSSLSFLMIDVDHFKKVNDTHGHHIGDQILVQLADILTKHARGSDIVCRFGGEEFLLLLPGTNADFARGRAEEIRQKAEVHLGRLEGHVVQVTLSIGIAVYPDHGQERDDVIRKADDALYKSKHEGRNRVTVWKDEAHVG